MTCIGIGIDVSKATLDISVHRHKKPLRTTNDPAGWKQAIAWMQPFEPTQVVLEATGGYEQDALDAFYSAGLPIIRVNPRQARDFAKAMGQLAKTDHGGWGAMELKTNVSRIRVRFTRQRLRINEL
ncbi:MULTISPECIES: IS110 family transposase [unclassified Pseudomonas]|uniref:IS110 family transposase n=1 Tax=unclassified Pseudomonas TaxID=196821 RepID=UPI00249C3981|nr:MULTISPECIES: transposase [unclassified Pseudomonas]MEB0191033.1 transposase [Pseudomonas sp. CCI1.1]WPX49345.1 transposase [Pseudomonas sp. CCI1.1]